MKPKKEIFSTLSPLRRAVLAVIVIEGLSIENLPLSLKDQSLLLVSLKECAAFSISELMDRSFDLLSNHRTFLELEVR